MLYTNDRPLYTYNIYKTYIKAPIIDGRLP